MSAMRRHSSGDYYPSRRQGSPDRFTGHYDDLKKVLDRTLSPRLPRLSPPVPPLPSSSSGDSTEVTTSSEELQFVDLDQSRRPLVRTLPELRSLKFGERPLPTPRRDSDSFPPSPRGRPPTSRAPGPNTYPPSPRSRSLSPPKRATPGKARRRVSLSPPKTPREGSSALHDTQDEDLADEWRSWRQGLPSSRSLTPRTPRMRSTEKASYPEVFRPPIYLDLPLSARSALSSKYLCEDDGGDDASGSLENGVAFYYPDEVRRMMAVSRSLHENEETGWSRREKLLLVLLLFAIFTVIVLFLVVFLVVSGVLGTANTTEIYNYGQPAGSLTTAQPANKPPFPVTPVPTNSSSIIPSPLATHPHVSAHPTTKSSSSATSYPPMSSTLMKTTTVSSSLVITQKGETTTMTSMKTTPKGVGDSSASSSTAASKTLTSASDIGTSTARSSTGDTAPTTSATTATTAIPFTTARPPTATSTTTTTTTTTTTPKPHVVCMTQKCAEVGLAVNASLMQAAAAAAAAGMPGTGECQDFYANACGKNSKSYQSSSTFSEEFSPLFNVVLEDLYKMTAEVLSQPATPFSTQGEKVAKAIFSSCKATNSIYDTFPAVQEMYSLFGSLGFNINLTSSLSIEDMHRTSLKEFVDGPLFMVERVPVFDGKKFQYLPMISPPRLVLDPMLYDPSSPPRQIQEVETSYVLTLSNILFSYFALVMEDNPPADFNKQIEERIRAVLNFEKQLEQILPDDTSDWTLLTVDTFTVAQVQQLTPSLSWTTMLDKRAVDHVRVYNKDYLETLDILLQRSDEDVVKTYIFYHVLFHGAWRFVPKTLREILMGFLSLDIPLDYSAADCARLTYEVAYQDTLQLLTFHKAETLLPELNVAVELVHNVTATMDSLFTGLGWLTEITRNFLSRKVSGLSTSNTDFGVRRETVNSEYQFNVSTTNSFLRNALERLRSLSEEERVMDERRVDMPETARFQFSPLYAVNTDTLYLPLAFIHLSSWLTERRELMPLYQYMASRSILYGLLHGETRDSWTEPSVLSFQDRISCMSANVVPGLPASVNKDHLTNLITAATALQFVNEGETASPREPITLGTNTFSDDKRFRFYLFAQAYCAGDIFTELGKVAPGKTKAEIELNFAVANDNLFGVTSGCEPGLPMSGASSCNFWDEDSFFDYN